MSKEGALFFKKGEESLKKYNRNGKEKKLVEAIEFFSKSADYYESSNDWAQAGESYYKASDCLQNHNQLSDAAIAATNAGKMFSKNHDTSQKAYDAFSLAARFYRENSKPTQGAQVLCESGKLFDDKKEYDLAIQCYKDAAQIYDDENKSIQAANQISIIADIYSTQNKWIEASDYFKDVAKRRYSQPLTKVSAIEFCMKSIICRMAADDIIGAEKYLNEYLMDFPAWEKSREYVMLRGLAHAINNHDSDEFTKIVEGYAEFTTLDNWMVHSLDVIKKLIENGEEEEIC
ncbi:hypothetical protein M9Y10_027104 [Tritrichomonas musculus]|uniref:Alpha-soluble NSF attachment protein n=1 Tax=Tritrichomonas musculus TaxID=1915356 RepID=A0ABR2H5P7_9EUKA